MVRKAMNLAGLTIHKREYRGPPSPAGKKSDKPPLAPPVPAEVYHIDCKHVMTGGLKATTEIRCLDGQVCDGRDCFGYPSWRAHADSRSARLATGSLEPCTPRTS